jgi:TAG lipase / lysophosphatidylethanolamine acyltransferase
MLWLRSRSPKDQLSYALARADTFEEWEENAFRLDELISADLWYYSPGTRVKRSNDLFCDI